MSRWGTDRTSTPEHRAWAHAVKTRDGYRCRRCGYQGRPGRGDVQADHITPLYLGGPEFDIDNGATLCTACHQAKSQAEAADGARRRAARARLQPEQHPGSRAVRPGPRGVAPHPGPQPPPGA
ncbi:HNH endonuclease [Nocardia puris]|uniref:HNH endonuclease n=1 Tax=Nocardia puris TaxID=208602 RepID=UPI0018939D5B|nr:HNH endonuclease [Nocardia puris]